MAFSSVLSLVTSEHDECLRKSITPNAALHHDKSRWRMLAARSGGIEMRQRFFGVLKAFVLGSVLLVSGAHADDGVPPCPDLNGQLLPVMNGAVAQWKHTMRNQWRHRARIQGYIDSVFDDHSGHHHFGLQISPDRSDDIEVIYNEDFGPMPELRPGMRVEACGDFIVATAPSNGYPASPLGAIIHWVHMNPAGSGHPPGYVWIDGVLCGQQPENAN